MRKPEEIAEKFADPSSLDDLRELYLVGIAGAGMSALAELALQLETSQPFKISGFDLNRPKASSYLTATNVPIETEASSDLDIEKSISQVEGVVLSDAIDVESDRVVKIAQKLNKPLFRRSQFLGALLKGHKLIAIAGTHGKTTTTGLVATAMRNIGFDPLVVEGAHIPQWNSSTLVGKGEWAIAEACEAYNGMLDLEPNVIILTNLEPDHLDFHGSYENLQKSMLKFASKLGSSGLLVYNGDDDGASEVALKANELYAVPIQSYRAEDGVEGLAIPGDHNKMNAAGALVALKYALAQEPANENVIASYEKALEQGMQGLRNFEGAVRRLQNIFNEDITVIDDYAHTPTEIIASIQATRDKYPFRRIIVVFQPHLYSRTQGAEVEFGKALSHADFVILTDIYKAREDPIPGVSSAVIAEALSVENKYVPNRHLLPRIAAKVVRPGDVVMGMGAGSIEEFAPRFVQEIERFGIQSGASTSLPKNRRLKVAVAYGGDSSEREVSLHSGKAIFDALKLKGHEPFLIDISEQLLSKGNLTQLTSFPRPDAVFLAVHGIHAEDGALQGLMELLHLPYTGSGILASAAAMDKDRTKAILREAGILTPPGMKIEKNCDQEIGELFDYILENVALPLIVKPNSEGSTVGVTFVRGQEELKSGLEKAFRYGDEILVEELIEGIEISTPVLCGKALLPVEIVAKSGIYDFSSKYRVGATEEIVPARLSSFLLQNCQDIAVKAHQILNCQGATRTDMIVRGDQVFVLEVNTLPGMTRTSLLPTSANKAGIPFPDLCEVILMDAINRYAQKT